MKLILLKVKDFRAYEGENIVEIDKRFTSFIGKNDIGKSTFFDALNIFFGNSKPDLSDLCVNSLDKSIELTCIFSDLPDVLEIDSGAETNLKDEYLLNENSYLEIKKVYKCTDKSINTSPEVYIVANYPDQSLVESLHKLNQKELKQLGESKGISVPDARMNHFWRKAIWQSIEGLTCEVTDLKIDEFETKAKKIYSKIEEKLPLFFVFKSDREMTDSDAEAKDPMQLAVAEAQKMYESEIQEIQRKIQMLVDEVANLALKKLHEVDPQLAGKLNPVLKSKPSWKFDYRIEDDQGIALNKRGSGTRRLVLFNFFRAQAEKKSLESNKGILYAIEEPETSQHPDNQRLIMEALTGLADNDYQIMITTHSAELLREIKTKYLNGIRFIQSDSYKVREIISGNDALILAAKALGILSKQMFGSAEKIVLVEGKADCLFLEHAAKEMKKSSEIQKDFTDAKVEVLPVGGCPGVKKWIVMDKHKKLGFPTYIFLDSDRRIASDDKTENEQYIESLKTDQSIESAFCTKKREIENYIKASLTGCTFGDFDDVKSIVPDKTKIPKKKLIDTYWTKMSANEFDEEIKNIIKRIIE